MSVNSLHILTVSQEAKTLASLKQLFSDMAMIETFQSVESLSDAAVYLQKNKPTLILVDLTGQEDEACLFIETINFKQNMHNKLIIFALHSELNPTTIIKAVSSGAKEYLQLPIDPVALQKAVEKHVDILAKNNYEAAHHHEEEVEQEAQVISVFSPKGGSGTSTIAVNMAYELSQIHGKNSTIIIDFDQSYCNMSGMVNVKATHSLGDIEYTSEDDFDEKMLGNLIIKHPSGLDLVFASKSILDENAPISESLLGQMLNYLREIYKYIIIDLPSHNIDNYHQLAVLESNRLLVVSAMDIPTLYRSRQYLELVKQHIGPEKIHLVINRHDLKGCVGLTPQELEHQFKHPVFFRLPNSWAITVEAVSIGEFVGKLDPTNPLAKSFVQLANAVSGVMEDTSESTSEKTSKGSLLGLIKRRPKVCHS